MTRQEMGLTRLNMSGLNSTRPKVGLAWLVQRWA